MLAGEPPTSLTIAGAGLADPVAVAAERKVKADAKAARDAERAAKQIEVVAEKPAPQVEKPAKKNGKARAA